MFACCKGLRSCFPPVRSDWVETFVDMSGLGIFHLDLSPSLSHSYLCHPRDCLFCGGKWKHKQAESALWFLLLHPPPPFLDSLFTFTWQPLFFFIFLTFFPSTIFTMNPFVHGRYLLLNPTRLLTLVPPLTPSGEQAELQPLFLNVQKYCGYFTKRCLHFIPDIYTFVFSTECLCTSPVLKMDLVVS